VPDTDYEIYSIGDAAVTLDFGNHIDKLLNRKALAIQQWIFTNTFPGLKDVIVSYSAVSVFFDPIAIQSLSPGKTSFQFISEKLKTAMKLTGYAEEGGEGSVVEIPVCYDSEFGYDLPYVSREKNLSTTEIIELHVSKIYYVYMLGFLPGFSYLAELNERLVLPRKPKPVPVVAGSVGIAGSQTGVYSLNCPGGWHIIGRTPLKLFDAGNSPPVWLKAGDHVRFKPISRDEFDHWV